MVEKKEQKQPHKLLTKYGIVKESGESLEQLEILPFLTWVKLYRKNNIDYPKDNKGWILLYKQKLSEEYAGRAFYIAEKL